MDSILPAYLARTGVTGLVVPDLATLRHLHTAHVETVPFENLDILLGRGIRLDLPHLVEKLIVQRRGGYCFEQNTLFLAALREIGFEARPMEARVRTSGTLLPRTHMVLVVPLDGEEWLADVGFGAEGLIEPVPLSGRPSAFIAGLSHRVGEEGDLRVLQVSQGVEWKDQYAFALRPVFSVDLEVANWFTSTHPESRFVRTLTAQRATPAVRHVLRYPTYTETSESGVRTREIARSELIRLLRDVFLIHLPDETVFPAIDRPAAAAHAAGTSPQVGF